MAVAADYVQVAQELYLAYFGRPADRQGLIDMTNNLAASGAPTDIAGFKAAMATNSTVQAMLNNFGNSTESQTLYGTGTDSQFITAIYQNVLNRDPLLAGLDYWTAALRNGEMTRAEAAVQILAAAVKPDANAIDKATALNKVAVATNFTAAIDTAAEVNAYVGKVAAQTARDMLHTVTDTTDVTAFNATVEATLSQIVNSVGGGTFIMTTGIDNASGTTIVGSLSTFIADGKGPTVNVGDTISGSGTDNTLTLADAYALGQDLIPAGVSIKNIQHVVLQTAGNAGAAGAAFNVSTIDGVLDVNVTSAGIGADLVAAAQTTAVVINHNNPAGGTVTTLGGSTVNVTTSGGNVVVGNANVGSAPLAAQVAAGAVTVMQNNTAHGGVAVMGGTDITVTVTSSSNDGNVEIGNVGANTGNTSAGAIANTTGNITVTTAGTGAVDIMGGTNVTVTDTAIKGAGAITVGDIAAVDASDRPAGVVTITETAKNAFSGSVGLNRVAGGDISVYGGTDVNVTTNAGGNVIIGDSAALGTNPTGNVTVTSTGVANGVIDIVGGADVTVTAAGNEVNIGQTVGSDNKAADNATGAIAVTETASSGNTVTIDGGSTVTVSAQGQTVNIGVNAVATGDVTVTQSDVLTGYGFANGAGDVFVGGGANVTVNTTGGDVTVGNTTAKTGATGAVSVTDTFSGSDAVATGNTDSIKVYGGTTVDIKVGATAGAITVGNTTVSLVNGTTLKDAGLYATGNVTIDNSRTNGDVTTYGFGATNVHTNGADTVSVKGGTVGTILDVQTTLATGGVNSGKAIGASTLATVTIDGNQNSGVTNLTSDALTNLTVTNDTTGEGSYVVHNTASHTLNLTVGGNDVKTFVDATATALNVTDNGTDGVDVATLTAAAATSATFSNSAAQAFDLSGDAKLATVTANNTGDLDLGDVSGMTKLASIDATKATGGVSVILDGTTTSFNGTGSTGADTVTLMSNNLLHGDATTYSNIFGGTGSNTLVADYVAGANDIVLGSNAHVKGFSTLGLGELASSATTHTAYVAASAASAELQTVTVANTAAPLNGDTFQLTVTVGAAAPVVVTFTAAGNETNAEVAAGLAGKLLAAGLSGVTVGYLATQANFTISGPADGTQITVVPASSGVGSVLTDNIDHQGGTAILGDNYYDASGFSALTVGATAGDVTFKNVAAGATLAVTDSQGGANVVNYLLATNTAADALALTVGTSKSTNVTTTVLTTSVESLSVESDGKVADKFGNRYANTVTIGDDTAKSVTVTGAQDVTLTLANTTNGRLTEAASKVTTINAAGSSGTVDVTGVALKDGAAHTITGGSGALIAAGGTNVVDVDAIATGSGGGTITIGSGGGWVAVPNPPFPAPGANGAYSAGSESINLSASAATTDTLIVNDGKLSTFNGSKGGVTGFVSGVTAADKLTFGSGAKAILANVTAPKSVNLAGPLAQNAASAIDHTGALWTALANLTYTVSNGVITFGATAGHNISDFTSGQLVSAAEIIVNAGVPGVAHVAAFSTGGNTYVVANDIGAQLGVFGGVLNVNADSIVELLGVSSVAGFGKTGAANTVAATNVTAIGADTDVTVVNTGTATAQVYNDSGFSLHNLATAAGTSYTLNNLAASSEIVVTGDNSGTNTNITTTQVGSSGNNSLTVTFGAAASFDKLTVSGDAVLSLNAATNANTGLYSVVDATNTISTIKIVGGDGEGGDFSLGSVSSTSLKTIDASTSSSTVHLGFDAADAAAPLTQDGLAVKFGAFGGDLVASGTGDVITQKADLTGAVTVTASGSATTITLGNGGNTITAAGAGDHITVGTGANTIVATGSDDVITIATAVGHTNATVGSNAIVHFTGTGAHDDIIQVGLDVTGGTSASYAFTTLDGFAAGDTIDFANIDVSNVASLNEINVATATTLAQALDMAANITGLLSHAGQAPATLDAGHAKVDWFQFGGDTYVVEAVSNAKAGTAAQTALDANDVVVKITGLVDLGNFSSGHGFVFSHV